MAKTTQLVAPTAFCTELLGVCPAAVTGMRVPERSHAGPNPWPCFQANVATNWVWYGSWARRYTNGYQQYQYESGGYTETVRHGSVLVPVVTGASTVDAHRARTVSRPCLHKTHTVTPCRYPVQLQVAVLTV